MLVRRAIWLEKVVTIRPLSFSSTPRRMSLSISFAIVSEKVFLGSSALIESAIRARVWPFSSANLCLFVLGPTTGELSNL